MIKRIRKRLMIAFMGIAVMMNGVVAYANEPIKESYVLEQSIKAGNGSHYVGESPKNSLRSYKIPLKSAGEIKITITGLTKGNTVTIDLEGGGEISKHIDVKPGKTNAVFHVQRAGSYVLCINNDSENIVKAYYTFTKKENQGGNSFSKATVLKKGVDKKGILGFDTPWGKQQFYKLKITKEELVKIKMTKGNSSSEEDVLCVEVYRSNNKKKPILCGYIYEGQKSATLYIRNSKNYKTSPGTYYIAVSKCYKLSSFDYSLTWLK